MKPFIHAISDRSHGTQHGKASVSLLVGILLFAALGGIGFKYYRDAQARTAAHSDAPTLSSGTTSVLNSLKSPVEIHFYSLLDPASTPASLRAYAKRVDELLARYEQAGNGNIRIVRYNAFSDASANAAAADGIHAFNRDKGDACYLGIATVCDGQKESIAELSPEWEPALESDLSRALAQVSQDAAPAAPPSNLSSNEMAAALQSIQSNPNLASASVDEGTQILRDAALADFKNAIAEMQQRSQQAEQSLGQGTSPADVAKQLENIRAEETAKVQDIAARLHNQIIALQESRKAPH